MKLFLLSLTLLVVSCADQRTKIINNSARVSDLERRMVLNEQLDAAQSLLIDAERSAREAGDLSLDAALQQEILDRAQGDANLQILIDDEAAARQAGDSLLANDLQIEIANRIAGDQQNSANLAASIFFQSLVNISTQFSISNINNRINQLNSRVVSLQNRVDSLQNRIEDLETETAQLSSDIETLEALLNARIDTVAAQAAATQAQLNAEGVKLFKCNSSSSTERIMKINGKFYAVMNRVSTETIPVFTQSSSITVSNPKLCIKDEKVKLPGGNGQCPSSWQEVGGSVTTIPAYSSSNRTVVSSVKIALDILSDGNYITTDGGPACSFSISNNGTSQTGLIAVQ